MILNGMEIQCYEELPILDAVEFGDAKMISAVGAGGKTTLLFTLAKALYQLGKKVVVTTSTHFHIPEMFAFPQILPILSEIQVAAKRGEPVACGEMIDEIRMRAPEAEAMEVLREYFDVVLVEADGSRGKPVKAPNPQEPVILPGTDLVFIVAGLSAVGREVREASYEPELVAELLETHDRHVLHTYDIARLMYSENGGQKNIPEDTRRVYVLNQADGFWGKQRAYKAAAALFNNGAQHIVVTDLLHSNNAKLMFKL